MFELIASLPPRNSTALPAFRHSPAASTVTLGRDSYTIPMTPSGTVIFCSFSPLGRTVSCSIMPSGSSNSATCSRPTAMSSMRSSVRSSRSSMAADSPACSPARMSCELASWMVATDERMALTIAARARFRRSLEAVRSLAAAHLARMALLSTSCWMFMCDLLTVRRCHVGAACIIIAAAGRNASHSGHVLFV